MPLADRLRERLQAHGEDHLADAELFAIVLGNRDTRVADQLLERFPDLRRMALAGIGELAQVPGLSVAHACRLKAALALAARLDTRPFVRGETVGEPQDVYRRLRPRLGHLDREVFVALALDARNRTLCELVLAEGGACSVELLPRDVFSRVVREAASAVIFIHNHPSGDPRPSEPDRELTLRLQAASELVGVRMLDHVIVAEEGYRAFSCGWEA
jgi:DNA repair protein RadC